MDIFTGWSSFSLHSLRRARKLGAVTVLERGSSHIQYQDDILRDEYDRFGINPVLPHEKIIEKELNEYEETDYISVPSSYVYNTFIEQGIPEHKLVMNAYGVELDEFYPGNRQDDVFRVIYCGAMSLRKGVQYLMQAFSELSLANSELLMVGDMLPEMEQIYDRYKSSTIKHRAAVKQSELRDIYVTGSVFILPSIEEGMAMVQAQAMACGLPLLCTTNTGGGDLIEDGQQGFVIPIRDVAELKDKIEWFYCNQELARDMGHAASEKVKSGFTWDDYGMRMYDIYTNMLGAPG
jgi:glycosyltransferase involved in cell wall biosynthesis